MGQGNTDLQGRLLMRVPEFGRRQPPDQKMGLVWAHAPGHQIATANVWPALTGQAQSVELTLGPLTDTEFLVLDPAGKPVAGATVEPGGIKTPVVTYSPPPRFIRPIVRAVTGADGRTRLTALTHEAFRSVQVTTAALGMQRLWFDEPRNSQPQRTIQLRSTGRIMGRIVADRPEWTRGVKVFITTAGNEGRRATEGTAEVASRADGLFLVPAIAVGRAQFDVRVDPTLPILPRIPDVQIQADAIARVDIRLEKTVRVRGEIRSRETSDPVAGVQILIGNGTPKEGVTVVSDSQGRFELSTLHGDVTMQLTSAQGSWIQLGDDPLADRHRVPAGLESFDLPPVEVVRGVTVQGRAVDAGNQPIASVSICADAATGKRQYGWATTNADGAFTMAIPGGVPLKYRYSFDQGGVPQGLDPGGELEVVRESPLLLRARRGESP
jgi:hypothetical protein